MLLVYQLFAPLEMLDLLVFLCGEGFDQTVACDILRQKVHEITGKPPELSTLDFDFYAEKVEQKEKDRKSSQGQKCQFPVHEKKNEKNHHQGEQIGDQTENHPGQKALN